MTIDSRTDPTPPLCTGFPSLDDVLGGGLMPHRLSLSAGMPGSGKTTLALQCLQESGRLGESVLYVTLSEPEEEARATADCHGGSLDGIGIREIKLGSSGISTGPPPTPKGDS